MKKTQAQAIIDYIKEHGSITTYEAGRELGITRIAARVWEMRKQGIDIKSERVHVNTRYGSAEVMRYTFAG